MRAVTFISRAMLIAASCGGFVVPGIADTQMESVFLKARKQVASLRVQGDKGVDSSFWGQEGPPSLGTGFVIASNSRQKQQIITAAHVVKPDAAWKRLPSGYSRNVYPTVEEGPASKEYRAVRAVIFHPEGIDLAQVTVNAYVKEPANMSFAVPASTGRFFIVSWPFEEREAAVEPRIREVKLVPTMEPDSYRLQIVKDTDDDFVPSESGSPVYDETGQVVAVVIQQTLDSQSRSRIAVALPISRAQNWLALAKATPAAEPKVLESATIQALPTSTQSSVLDNLVGLCVYLGKRSAGGALPGSKQALFDAPFGGDFIKKLSDYNKDRVVTSFVATVLDYQVPGRDPDFGGVKVRTGCPEVVKKPEKKDNIAFYPGEVARLDSRFDIGVSQIQPKEYLDDIFYWGVISFVKKRETRNIIQLEQRVP